MAGYLDHAAIPKCYDHLGKAKEALYFCRNASNFEKFASHWASFLIHTGGVLNALAVGARKTPQARQWFGGIERQGRQDQLVNYMHQARNAEEHELNQTAGYEPSSIAIGGPGESVYINKLTTDEAFYSNPRKALDGMAWNQHGKTPTVMHTKGGPKLLPVTNSKFKNVFYPPTEHEGKPLQSLDPLSIGELYLIYLVKVVSEARDLA